MTTSADESGTVSSASSTTGEGPSGTSSSTGLTTRGETSASSSSGTFEPTCGDGEPGPGEFCFEEGDELSFQDYAVALSVGDVDGDGNRDVFQVIPDQAQLLLGDGMGGLSNLVESTDILASDGAAIADLDGDGQLDVVYVGTADIEPIAGVAYSDGLVFQIATGVAELPASVREVRASATVHGGQPGAVFLLEDRLELRALSPGVSLAPSETLPLSGSYSLLAIGDMNGDGIDDVLAGRSSLDGSFSVVTRRFGGGGGTWVQQNGGVLEALGVSGEGLSALELGDFNGDGDLDVALAVSNAFVIGFGDGVAGFLGSETFGSTSAVSALAAVDLDGDGADELLAVSNGGPAAGLRVLSNLDDNAVEVFAFEPDFTFGGVAAGDLNGDGVPELVVYDDANGGVAQVLVSTP